MDLSQFTNVQLKNLIDNYSREKNSNSKLYKNNPVTFDQNFQTIRSEYERRIGRGLSFEASMAAIKDAAKHSRFLSYKDLADASGADWQLVHYEIGKHLFRLVSYAHDQGWPMLSAIVVNKPNIDSGNMEPETLKGFIAAAKELGIPVHDENEFLKDEQRRVFDWGQRT